MGKQAPDNLRHLLKSHGCWVGEPGFVPHSSDPEVHAFPLQIPLQIKHKRPNTFRKVYASTSEQSASKKKVSNYFALESQLWRLMLCKFKMKFALEIYKVYTFPFPVGSTPNALQVLVKDLWGACPFVFLQYTYWELHWCRSGFSSRFPLCAFQSNPREKCPAISTFILFMLLSYWIFCLDLPRKQCCL